jgi:peptide/nickel transport system permease protein
VAKTAAIQLAKLAALLLAVSFISFALVSASPIDAAQANVGQLAWLNMSDAQRAQLHAVWGQGTPLLERYANWLGGVLTGDMGTSLRFNAPVTQVIGTRLLNSLALMLIAWLASGILGFVLGVVAGVQAGRWPDKLIKGYCLLLASTPTFWLALIVLMVFAVWLGWFPIGFSQPIGVPASQVTLVAAAQHLVLPALTLSVVGISNIALHTREKTIDVMQSPYVQFARARGQHTSTIVLRHALRNLSLPAITLQFASLAEIIGGSVLVEQVFSYPGLGQAAVTAGLGGDAALLTGIAVVTAALVFAGNATANILYKAIDPRLKNVTPHLMRGLAKSSQQTAEMAVGSLQDDTSQVGEYDR